MHAYKSLRRIALPVVAGLVLALPGCRRMKSTDAGTQSAEVTYVTASPQKADPYAVVVEPAGISQHMELQKANIDTAGAAL